VQELVDTGAAAPGEIVLLFAAGTDAEWYEEELRTLGLPTYRATGRGYFGQQQVVDLLAYLRLLQNRYDDEALLTVLASPFVGVSNDALVLIRDAAGRRPLFSGLEREIPPALAEDDARMLKAFRQRYERLAGAMGRLSLERLCDAIVSEHDYDLAVLAQWDGRRRYANLRKLARLARSYEELRGADVEGFIRFVAAQDAVGARELEAVAEEEGADAVRLLTIHAAKGLEFKVVIVADAGRDKAPPASDEILALSDGRFGFRVADPSTSTRRGSRWLWSVGARPCSFASTGSVLSRPTRWRSWSRTASSRSSPSRRKFPRRAPLPSCRRSHRSRWRRCTACGGCRSRRSPSSSSARTVTTRSGWPGCASGGRSVGLPAAPAASLRPRSETPRTSCSSRLILRHRSRPMSSRCAPGTRP